MNRWLLAILSALVPFTSSAESALELTDILVSVATNHPDLAIADATLGEERGRRLAASAPFEPKVTGLASARPLGYYDYWQLALAVEQTVPGTGIQLEGGYRLGRGDFPVYYGQRETRDGGEVFANIAVPLLADRSIDDNRAKLRKASIAIEAARATRMKRWLELARDASLGYWEWVAAGHKLAIATELLRIAQIRADNIHEQVRSGAQPRIAATDAERVLLARRSRVLDAEASFAKAQQKLSLFWRDESQTPRIAELARVPTTLALPPRSSVDELRQWVEEALARRPELRLVEQKSRAAHVELREARNQRLPALDLVGSVARDLGDGSESLAGTDVGIGLKLTIPLLQRRGRGLEHAATAKLAQADAERRGLRDRIAAAIREHAQVAELAHRRAALAGERMTATESLAEAERERLRQGDSDILTVNLRELDVQSAANEAIDAALSAHRATIELLYARGNLPEP